MEQQVGQLVMLGLDRPQAPPELLGWIRERRLGGVFLYGEALGPVEQTAELTRRLQAAAPGDPLLIAVDQEGGRVQAWGPPHRPALPAAAEVGAAYADSGDAGAVRALARALAAQLREGGINLDFAPVLDVHTNPENPIIGDRSPGPTPELVSAVGRLLVSELQAGGVLACGKHFPGHGDTRQDSHLTLPVVDHPLSRLEAVELPPFAAGIAAGLQTIMTAHVLYPALDPRHPATVSSAIIDGLLRRRLGFDGVVVTDDLAMRGIRDRHDLLEAALAALAAGCDLLLSATEHGRHEALLRGLQQALADGRLDPGRLAASLRRVRRAKARLRV
jgi:beta-N-acetylhexosaminidase